MLAVLLTLSPCLAATRGVMITPDSQGNYRYFDDFPKWRLFDAKFLRDPFLTNLDKKVWNRLGWLENAGPNKDRMLTYRFYGERIISNIAVRIEQSAHGSVLGGRNLLYLSANGVDWTQVATSEKQSADEDGWQTEPLTVSTEQAEKFVGQSEVWVRVVLDNTSGVKTTISNRIDSIDVKLKTSEQMGAQAALGKLWGKLSGDNGYRSISLDWSDPAEYRPPHYYEDSDGWPQPPGANPFLATDEDGGFTIQRAYSEEGRLPVSLITYVETDGSTGPMIAKIVVAGDLKSSRKMKVLWNDELLETFDTRSSLDEMVFFVEIPSGQKAGAHQLRIAGGDKEPIVIKQLSVAVRGSVKWVEKPPLPRGGRLETLSAYYMPDPKPPAGSQTVEGRHEKKDRPIGMIFRPLQRLYAEHADFGGARVVIRNTSDVPVRVSSVLFNDKPIEAGYIDFPNSEWDSPGIVWYRVRPKLIQPGRCAQVSIRFRRHPAGEHGKVTVELENGSSATARFSYKDPGVMVDYVTTGSSPDTLYVYVRRSPSASPDSVTAVRLDSKQVRNIEIYGADFPGNVALIVAKLPKALKVGDYHTVGIKLGRGKWMDAQFKVLPFFYPRSSIYASCKITKQHNMNFAMGGNTDFETMKKYDLKANRNHKGVFNTHARILFIFGPDEPDAWDWRGSGKESKIQGQDHAKGLGWHARMLIETGWLELVEHHCPHVASNLMLDGTTRPLNWMVYGQLTDIITTDPYTVYGYHGDHTFVRESLLLARLASRPNRLYACLEAFNWGPTWDYRKGKGRLPLPAEYRYDLVQAIGSGMKGLTSYKANSWLKDKALTEEITKTNKLIERIEDKLLMGTLIDLVSNDSDMVLTGNASIKKWPKKRVWTSSLLCGPDTIIIAATNHIPASYFEPPKVTPAEDVTITVNLPDYLINVEAFEVTGDGIDPYPYTSADGKVLLKLTSIEAGRVFLLKRK